MARPFRELIERMPEDSQKRIAEGTKQLLVEMELKELREALDMTQVQLAQTLKKNQAAISKMEHQSDIYISTLRSVLEAMGAKLKVVASFPEGDVLINQFTTIHKGSNS